MAVASGIFLEIPLVVLLRLAKAFNGHQLRKKDRLPVPDGAKNLFADAGIFFIFIINTGLVLLPDIIALAVPCGRINDREKRIEQRLKADLLPVK